MRWGILGCGLISNDFVNGLKSVQSAQVVACAARSQSSMDAFRVKHDIATGYDSYEALCKNPLVDIVYVGTIHTKHFEHAKMALRAGKHVLVEKPWAMNGRQARELVRMAQQHQRFLMEGMWTRFFPAIRQVRKLLDEGEIGQILHVNADFGVSIPDTVERIWTNELGGGALLDLGIYPIAFLSMAYHATPPSAIHIAGATRNQVDYMSNITLTYPGDRYGTAQVSSLASTAEEVHITGTQGRIKIHSPAHVSERVTIYRSGSSRGDVQEHVLDFPLPVPPPDVPAFNFPGSNGFQYEAESVQDCIAQGRLENPEYTWNESLLITDILQSCREQLGVHYPCDDEHVSGLS